MDVDKLKTRGRGVDKKSCNEFLINTPSTKIFPVMKVSMRISYEFERGAVPMTHTRNALRTDSF